MASVRLMVDLSRGIITFLRAAVYVSFCVQMSWNHGK
jgi:hypothetical protein